LVEAVPIGVQVPDERDIEAFGLEEVFL